jgi:hypothetical protein
LTAVQVFVNEFGITIANGEVWLSIGLALVLGGLCWLFGTWVARRVGLLQPNAPAGEVLGVGLAVGLMVLAAWGAAVWSGGRSSFTPVAIGFSIAIALGVARRARGSRSAQTAVSDAEDKDRRPSRLLPRNSLLLMAVGAGGFVIAVAILYGSTLAPSPRDGVQPVEFNDVAFYAVLGRDLATTGIETNLSASGFSDLPGLPSQTWYHWGELWLASALIKIFGTGPLAARYFVVLPLVLLAAAALTGTVVRRMTRTGSRRIYLFGFAACLFLAPVALIPGPFFSSWAVGLIFGITLYGLSAVAVLLALYSLAVLRSRDATWALASFVGSAIAFILPAHIAVALLVMLGTGFVWAIRVGQSLLTTHRMPIMSPVWRRSLITLGALLGGTLAWGILTGHDMGGGGSPPVVSPFNASWRESVLITTLGAGILFAIPVAWLLVRKKIPVHADLYSGTMVILVGGAIAWGARLGDFTMFYLFFAGIAVIATPVAVIAVRILWQRLRAMHRLRLATGLVVLCVLQLEVCAAIGTFRLTLFGAQVGQPPIPVQLLAAMRELPPEAELAYRCRPFSEAAFGTPQLVSIDLHTDRRVVPMCFTGELFSFLNGAELSDQIPNMYFRAAPQRALYPDAASSPSSSAVASFLKGHGIQYIYADATHPNTLVNDAVVVASSGGAEVLKVP